MLQQSVENHNENYAVKSDSKNKTTPIKCKYILIA